MQPEKFIEIIRKQVIKDNIEIYRQIFESISNDSITDDYWKEVIPFFHQLDSTYKETLFKIIRQVKVDTISNLLGIIDGVTGVTNEDGEFELKFQNQIISGDLQDVFLEQEEIDPIS